MRRETANILLILLGGALVKLVVSGEYLRYVKPAHQPWMLGGGAIMVLLGLVAVARDLRWAGGERTGHEDGHAHGTRSAWMLLVPVLTVLLVAPPALGSDSVERAQARSARVQPGSAVNAAFPPLPSAGVVPLPVSDFAARAGWDDTGTLDGRTVRLTGFLVHRGEQRYLARMAIGCCAADASPVTVLLRGDAVRDLAGLPNDTWIEVTGEVVPGSATERSKYVPELTVGSVRPIPEPADPYES